jgi:hypothetical protein
MLGLLGIRLKNLLFLRGFCYSNAVNAPLLNSAMLIWILVILDKLRPAKATFGIQLVPVRGMLLAVLLVVLTGIPVGQRGTALVRLDCYLIATPGISTNHSQCCRISSCCALPKSPQTSP